MLKHFRQEKIFWNRGYDFVIGIDEAGRGPLAGPVVAAAVIPRNFQFSIFNFQSISNDKISNDQNFRRKLNLIKDSKLLTEKQRENLYDFILDNFHIGIGICDHKTIDRVNILQATHLAMKKSLSDLNSKIRRNLLHSEQTISTFQFPISNKFSMKKFSNNKRVIILIDGNKIIPNVSISQKAVVNGDEFIKTISAASIIAKVTRDRIMKKMHKIYPEYCFDRHKGYGTAYHRKMIKKHGTCPIHRRSFKLI